MLTTSLLMGVALKSLPLAGATLGLLRLARGRTPAERSLIAHLGLLAVLLLPIASMVLPAWAPLPQAMFAPEAAGRLVPAPASTLPTVSVARQVPVPAPTAAFVAPPAEDLAIWIYALPLAVLFGAMAIAVLRLFGMRSRAEVLVDGAWLSALAGAQRRMGLKHGTALLVSEELRSPISWGVLRPTILLDPRAVAAVSDAEAIIAHELAHVVRLDWAKLLVARLACALFWFNPLVWLLARESHQLREEAADDSVLMSDISGSDYATLLVNAARHDNKAALIAAHGVAPAKNSLHRRILRVLDTKVRRGPARRGWAALGMVVAFAVAAPLAAFTTAATQTAEATAAAASQTAPAPRSAATPAAPRQAGRAPLTPEDLVGMRAVGVEPADLEQMRDSHGRIDADSAIAAKATGVTPAYVAEMRSVFPNADVDELVGASSVGVDAAFAREMRTLDPRAGLDDIVGARAVGVTPGYVREIRSYFPHVSLDQLIGMRATGVSGKDIEAMRASGIPVEDPDDVTAVRAVTGSRGRSSRAPATITAVRPGATAVIGPGGVYASRRDADGSVHRVVTGAPPAPDHDDD